MNGVAGSESTLAGPAAGGAGRAAHLRQHGDGRDARRAGGAQGGPGARPARARPRHPPVPRPDVCLRAPSDDLGVQAEEPRRRGLRPLRGRRPRRAALGPRGRVADHSSLRRAHGSPQRSQRSQRSRRLICSSCDLRGLRDLRAQPSARVVLLQRISRLRRADWERRSAAADCQPVNAGRKSGDAHSGPVRARVRDHETGDARGRGSPRPNGLNTSGRPPDSPWRRAGEHVGERAADEVAIAGGLLGQVQRRVGAQDVIDVVDDVVGLRESAAATDRAARRAARCAPATSPDRRRAASRRRWRTRRAARRRRPPRRPRRRGT